METTKFIAVLAVVVILGLGSLYVVHDFLSTVKEEIKSTSEEFQQTAEISREAAQAGKESIENTSKEAQEAIAELRNATEEAKERITPAKISDVEVEVAATRATLTWKTDKSAGCIVKIDRLGQLPGGVSYGINHKEVIHALCPGKTYYYTIEVVGGKDYYSGSFITKSLTDWRHSSSTSTVTHEW